MPSTKGTDIGQWSRVGSLGVLALGLGGGAALATGVANAGPPSADGGAGALGVAAVVAAADFSDAAVVGSAAATLPTLPTDFSNIAISISGLDLVSLGTATAESSFGNIAIAYGDGSDAYATNGFFNFAAAQGPDSFAEAGDHGSFNYAWAVGDHASASAVYGDGNVASAVGDYAVASAGASVQLGVYDSNFNTATAEGAHAVAYAGWDGSSDNVASALGDYALDFAPQGQAWSGAAGADLLGDFWSGLWSLFS